METDANLSSPVKDEEKTQEKQEQNIAGKSKFTENKEGSEGSTLGEKTVESDVKSSEKDLCKVENTGLDIKGSISVSNNGVDNKENETKGDDKQSLFTEQCHDIPTGPTGLYCHRSNPTNYPDKRIPLSMNLPCVICPTPLQLTEYLPLRELALCASIVLDYFVWQFSFVITPTVTW